MTEVCLPILKALKAIADLKYEVTATIAVEHYQQSIKRMSKSTTHYTSSSEFKDNFKQRKGTAEGEAGFKGFGASFKATWDNVDHFVHKKDTVNWEQKSESVEFMDGFLQLARVVTTTINMAGEVVTVKDTQLVDSIAIATPLNHEELEKRSNRYLVTYYPGYTYPNGTTATKSISVSPPKAPQKYVKNVEVISFDRENTPENVVKCCGGKGNDLNKGFGGKFTYLVAKSTTNRKDAATGFHLVRNKNSMKGKGRDFAEGAGGDHRYIERETTGNKPILWNTLELYRDGKNAYSGAKSHTVDLNQGRKKDFLHLLW